MSTFFLDVWHDLKQKRLWPVAVVLLVAAIAVPIVLIKPVSDEGTPPAGATADAARSVVNATDEPEAGSSDLERFDSKNPFRSQLEGDGTGTSSAEGAKTEIDRAGSATDASGGGSSDAAVAGAGGGSPASSASSSAGASGSPVSGGGSSGGGSGGGGSPGSAPETEYFTYTVDVMYGRTGSTRKFEGLRTLEVLTDRNPRLMFVGAADEGDTAAFSVLDPTLRDRGEGDCVEVGDSCSVLFLKIGQEHRFAEDDGDEYRVRLLDVNEVRFNR